ncbi:hypothetical protein CNY67_09395 [Desulfovibrio sp. G11]|nr:hypothetical protein CNY67_09395 [Desulfovibrio sp. G11]
MSVHSHVAACYQGSATENVAPQDQYLRPYQKTVKRIKHFKVRPVGAVERFFHRFKKGSQAFEGAVLQIIFHAARRFAVHA